jgi:methylmalonyl-CoA mutase C-terminal domain/subunit
VVDLLKEQDAADIKVFVGGIIPEADIQTLREAGIAAVFTPGTPTQEIVDWAYANLR